MPKAKFQQTYKASKYGPACLQQHNPWIETLSEDCLTLNVFVPKVYDTCESECKLPVMIYLHGGGFMRDTAAWYPGQHLSAFGRVIVVTMNYRLGHMGFLRTNEEYGNFGLWDQREAIVWVKDNIEAFGGNTSEITVFGESAGSSAVLYQALYSDNINLFQRVIAQSGGITSPWAFTTTTHANAIFQNFSREIGCAFDDHEMVMACLRNKSSQEIADLITNPDTTLSFDRVVPNLDNDFVPFHPRKMLEASSATEASIHTFRKLDFMMGSCSIDGAVSLPAYMAALNISDVNDFKVPRDVYEENFIPNMLASTYTDMDIIPEIVTDATTYKYTYWSNVTDDIQRSKQLIDLSSDTAFFVPMVNTSRLHLQGIQSSTYVYLFSTVPSFRLYHLPDWLKSPTNTYHAEELVFIFGFSIRLIPVFSWFPVTDEDIAASKNVMSMWSNFAKTGDPNKPYSLPVHWPAFDLVSQNYLDITASLTTTSVKANFEADRVAFWANFLPNLFQKCH